MALTLDTATLAIDVPGSANLDTSGETKRSLPDFMGSSLKAVTVCT
jgi:hypothetical protein